MTVDPRAQAGFTAASKSAYEKGRPGYPAELLDWMVSELGLAPGSLVADLGAGTGKFTRLMVERGARVIAIEPVEGMRGKLSGAGTLPVAGLAEAIPLRDASVDLVTAAQAFHWFRLPETLGEMARVMRGGAAMVLVWNQRDNTGEWPDLDERLDQLGSAYGLKGMAFKTTAKPPALDRDGPFTRLERERFGQAQELDLDGLTARVMSSSSVAGMPADRLSPFEAELRDLLAAHPVMALGTATVPYTTEAYWSRRR